MGPEEEGEGCQKRLSIAYGGFGSGSEAWRSLASLLNGAFMLSVSEVCPFACSYREMHIRRSTVHKKQC